MKLATFKGGVHPPDCKLPTRHKEIIDLPPPQTLIIPLSQHIGTPCEPTVSVGDYVYMGQVIGESKAPVSAPIHASASGTVSAIEERLHPSGLMVNSVIIENDFRDAPSASINPIPNFRDLKPEDIVKLVKNAGIVGMGGASFPTHIKLSPPPDINITHVIINGAECEPYLTSDHRAMIENPEDIILGLKIMLWNFRLRTGYIGIEENKRNAIKVMTSHASMEKGVNIQVIPLKTKYPQGSEKQVVQAVTGKLIPPGKLPMHVGAVVNNIDTCASIARAVKSGMPLISRIVTVSGDCVKTPSNFRTRIGTPFKYLFDKTGEFVREPNKIIMGGPMMGICVPSLDVPVTKGTSAILAFSKDSSVMPEESACIRCGRCVSACPMKLMPIYLNLYSKFGDFEKLNDFNISDCIECGSCSYICPSNRHLVQSIKVAKSRLALHKTK